MEELIKSLKARFVPPFRSSGRAVTDRTGLLVANIQKVMIDGNEERALAKILADALNQLIGENDEDTDTDL